MIDLSTLRALQVRARAAEGPDRELEARLHHALHPHQDVMLDHGSIRPPRDPVYGSLSKFPIDGWVDWEGVCIAIGAGAYTGSIDAAVALIEKLLPDHMIEMGRYTDADDCQSGCFARVSLYCSGDGPRWEDQDRGTGKTLPLALLDALFSGLIAKAKSAMTDSPSTGRL